MPHDSPEARFLMLKIMAKLKLGHPNGGTKCRWDTLNADTVPENWRLPTLNIVNLVWLQVYHTERPTALLAACSPRCSVLCRLVSDRWSLSPLATVHNTLAVQLSDVIVFFHNLSPSFLWPASSSYTLHFIIHAFFHPLFSSFLETYQYRLDLLCRSTVHAITSSTASLSFNSLHMNLSTTSILA